MTHISAHNRENHPSGSAVPQLVEYSFGLSTPCKSAFLYLSDPSLLDLLTPSWFRLRIVAADPVLDVGARIDYRMRWRGIGFRWQSEITDWQPPFRFTYRQRRGPYRFFEHEHFFTEEGGGTRITDRIRFHAPGGVLFQRAVVGPELERILRYRRGRARELPLPGRLDAGHQAPDLGYQEAEEETHSHR